MKNNHKTYTIYNWKRYGIISDDFDKLYNYHINISNCEICKVSFNKEIKNQRCLDHDHKTGLYRKTLCRSCNASYLKAPQTIKSNNSTGHMWIENARSKNKSGNYSFTWRYHRVINKILHRKCFKTLTKAIAYSFIQLLKHPYD